MPLSSETSRKHAALVVIQDVAIEGKPARSAIHRDAAIKAVRIRARLRRRVEIEFQIIRDKEVELPVVVVIDKCAAGVIANAILSQMNFRRDVFEAMSAHVAIERILSPVSDEQIGKPVVIVVARADALRPAFACEAQGFRHVAKLARRLRCDTCGWASRVRRR